MLINAIVENEPGRHRIALATGDRSQSIEIAPRASGAGSSVNGGELLCLALATCYCNDIYREAQKCGIAVVAVTVEANAEFGAAGAPASRLSYRATVCARAPEAAIRDLIVHTDKVAEIQNTLRLGMPVTLESFDAIPVGDAPAG